VNANATTNRCYRGETRTRSYRSRTSHTRRLQGCPPIPLASPSPPHHRPQKATTRQTIRPSPPHPKPHPNPHRHPLRPLRIHDAPRSAPRSSPSLSHASDHSSISSQCASPVRGALGMVGNCSIPRTLVVPFNIWLSVDDGCRGNKPKVPFLLQQPLTPPKALRSKMGDPVFVVANVFASKSPRPFPIRLFQH
jgi:hypothetical protein